MLLQAAGGKMSYMQLIKMLYLADRDALITLNRPITGDEYYAMKYGPVLSTVLNLVRFGDELFPPHEHWSSVIEKSGKYDVRLKQDVQFHHLSEAELKILNKVVHKFRDMDKWELVEYCHKHIKEWREPGNSAFPITHEQILRAVGWSDQQIEQTREEIEHVEYVRSVLKQ